MPNAATVEKTKERRREIVIIVSTARSTYAFFFQTPLY